MDKDLKNIGVAFALGTVADNLSLTKISLSMFKGTNGIYNLASKDGKISININLNDDDLEETGEDILKQILEYTHEKLTHEKCSFDADSELSRNAQITSVVNELKEQAREYFQDKYSHKNSKTLSNGEKELMALEDRIFNLQDSFYNSLDDSNCKDMETFEYGLACLDEIYGTRPIDPNVVYKDSNTWALQNSFEESASFLEDIRNATMDEIEEILESEGDSYNDTEIDIAELESLDDLSPDDMSTIDYMIYRKAKEDYNKAQKGENSKDLPTEKEISQALADYINRKYIEELSKMMDLKDSSFLQKLCDKAEELFGNDKDMPKDNLAKLGEIFAEDISEEEFDDMGGESLEDMLDEDDMENNR